MSVRKPLLTYFAIAFTVSWSGVMLAATQRSRLLWFIAMLFGPTLAALSLVVAEDGTRGLRALVHELRRVRVGARYYAAPLIAPAVLVVVLSALTLASPDFAPSVLRGAPLARMLLIAVLGGLLAGVFEELGWTGFATPRLLQRFSWLGAGLLLGLPWALWHLLPDYLARTMPGGTWLVHALEWVVALTAMRVLMTWVYQRAASLPLAMLMHATFTGSQLLLWPARVPARVELLWYGAFACALCLVVIALVLRIERFTSVAATAGERARPMPGDYVVPFPLATVTHAITIASPPERIWQWLPQMGTGRAGFYSYDALDNDGVPSANRVLVEHQHLRVGDRVPANEVSLVVAKVKPPRDLVLAVPGEGAPAVSWEHLIEPNDDGTSRLIVRGRVARGFRPPHLERLPDGVALAIARVVHRVMEARHLRSIKRRAELFA